jgi:hypothetical protein
MAYKTTVGIDECTAVQLLGPLTHVLPRHQVDHITQIKWAGKKNRSVLADAKGAGYGVIITRDRHPAQRPGRVRRHQEILPFTTSATSSGTKDPTGSARHVAQSSPRCRR